MLMTPPNRVFVISTLLLGLILAACGTNTAPDSTVSGLRAIPVAPTQTTTPRPTPGPQIITVTPHSARATDCADADIAARLRAVPAYEPNEGPFATLDGAGFTVEGKPFPVRGVNYYPARAPWQHFTADNDEARLVVIGGDFSMLHDAGINTVRVFLWYDALFVCPGNGAVPDPATFAWLDGIFRLANTFDLRLILTLNHLPSHDMGTFYADPGLTLAHTAYIVRRYRDEPRLLAWDVRDAGDADYAPSVYGMPLADESATATRDQVLDWLARTAAAVRQMDDRHPVTAGWSQDAAATVALVDVVSLQHYGDPLALRARIAELRSLTGKPLLLIAAGATDFAMSASDQASWLDDTLRVTEIDQLAGWLVWTMYDFPLDVTCWPEPCASMDDIRHHFGLWQADGTTKPAADMIATHAAAH